MKNRNMQEDFDQAVPVQVRDNAEPLTTADMAAASAPARTDARTGDMTGAMTGAENENLEKQQEGFEPLFDERQGADFRSRWFDIQAGFVDEPRKSVEKADELVAAAIKRLAEIFADERKKLEAEWGSGDDVSTEDLRVALRRYRSFFDRLLSV